MLAGGDVDTTIDPVALQHYMSFHAVVPPPLTILTGVRKLPPATVRVIDSDGTSRDILYWNPVHARAARYAGLTDGDWQDLVLGALRTAVQRRMVADVPVGVLLSGGIDSSVIVALLADEGQQGLQTFSIGFEAVGDAEGDEFEFSDLVAREFGTDHHRLMVPSSEVLSGLDGAVGAMSEPMVSHDCVAFYLLSQQVSQHVKVVQSGQGADEILAGYEWYPPLAGVADDSVEDALAVYSANFFDRPHAELAGILEPQWRTATDHARALAREHFARPGADTAFGPCAAARLPRDAGRRPRQAGGQHDHGVGAGGRAHRSWTTSSSSSLRPCHRRSNWPAAGRVCSRRRPERCCLLRSSTARRATSRCRRSSTCRGSTWIGCGMHCLRRKQGRVVCSRPATSRSCWPTPNRHRTNLGSN